MTECLWAAESSVSLQGQCAGVRVLAHESGGCVSVQCDCQCVIVYQLIVCQWDSGVCQHATFVPCVMEKPRLCDCVSVCYCICSGVLCVSVMVYRCVVCVSVLLCAMCRCAWVRQCVFM